MLQLSEVNPELEALCYLTMATNTTYDESLEEPFCNAVWDTVFCWPPTRSGSEIKILCSQIFQESYSAYAAKLQGYAYRECLTNGTWRNGLETNYDECRESFQFYLNGVSEINFLVPIIHQILFWGSIFSLVCLGTSLGIFFKFRCLHCDRVTVHAQLMLSLVLRFILMFIIAEPFVIGHTNSYRDVEILCETVLVLFLYFTFSSISWMFVQGLYLNIALTKGVTMRSSTHQLTIYHVIGWGVPAGFTCAYVISMAQKTQKTCWEGYSEMDEMWILLGPITFELAVNGLFLLNILRILLRKIRNSTTRPDTSQLKAVAKATIILFPILGINDLVLLYKPGGDYNKYFVILNTFFGSAQGIFISIVFCFADKEVRAAICRSIERVNARRMATENRIPNNLPPPVAPDLEVALSHEELQSDSNFLEHTV